MRQLTFFLILAGVVQIGCYKNEDNSSPKETVIEVVEVFVNTKIAGTVLDKDGTLIKDYTVKVNEEVYEIEGISFVLDLIKVKKNGQLITVYKENKIIAAGIFFLVENDVNQIQFNMFGDWETEIVSGSTSSLLSSVLIDLSGAELSLSKSPYSGKVELNTQSIAVEKYVSGVGYSLEGDLLSVQGFGGFQFELRSIDGNTLSSSNRNIKLTLHSIPNEASSLFQLDLDKGRFVLVADDIKTNDIVKVEKGGFFLYANYQRGVFVKGDLSYKEVPIAFASVEYKSSDFEVRSNSTINGRWFMAIPQESDGELFSQNSCGDQVTRIAFSTLDSDISKVYLLVENDKNLYKPDLEITDCNGALVQEPIMAFSNASMENILVFNTTDINKYVVICDKSNVSGINNLTGSRGQAFSVKSEVENISNCEDFKNGYLGLEIEGERKAYGTIEKYIENGKLIFKAGEAFTIIIKGVDNGLYEDDQINIGISDSDFGQSGYFLSCLNSTLGCGISFCEVKTITSGNEKWTSLSFSGTLWMETISPKVAGKYDVAGNFLIK